MIKKMQRRFILASMAAFALVMGVLVVGINFANYIRITAYKDTVLNYIYDYHRESDPQSEFTKGFFVVQYDEEGILSRFDQDYISSIDEQAAEFAQRILLRD